VRAPLKKKKYLCTHTLMSVNERETLLELLYSSLLKRQYAGYLSTYVTLIQRQCLELQLLLIFHQIPLE